MGFERQLAKYLKRLNRAIQKLVAQSDDLAELRKLLREEKVDLAIYVVPLVGGRSSGGELKFELTDQDRFFLKQAGIRFE